MVYPPLALIALLSGPTPRQAPTSPAGSQSGRRRRQYVLRRRHRSPTLGGWAQYLMAVIIFLRLPRSWATTLYAQVNGLSPGKQHKHYFCGAMIIGLHCRRLLSTLPLRVEPVRPRHGGEDRH